MPGPRPLIDQHFRLNSSKNVAISFVDGPLRLLNPKGRGWRSYSTNHQPCPMSRLGHSLNYIPIPYASGVTVGLKAISPWLIKRAAGESPIFPPRDRAIVKAIACEAVCQTNCR